MKSLARFFFVLGFIVASLGSMGCTRTRDHLNPLDPSSGITPTPTPVPQQLWKNGVIGTFAGYPLSVTGYAGAAVASASVVAVTDNITSDTSTLQLAAVTSTNYINLSVSSTPSVNIIGYHSGHARFNIRLEKSAASFTSLVAMGTTLSLAGLSTSTFTHIDVPIQTWAGGVSTISSLFVVEANLTSGMTGPIVTVNDIRWTAD